MRFKKLLVIAVLGLCSLPSFAQTAQNTYWSERFRYDRWKPGEDQKVFEAVGAFAAEWKLETVVPAPGSAVQKAYAKGSSAFEGTFYMTVMVAGTPTVTRPSLLVEVALDPKSSEDQKTLKRFLSELKHRLRKVLASPVYSKTVKKVLPPE